MALPERVAYVNGKLVPESQASVSINDLGFLYGDAAFDTTRTFHGRIFKLPEHLDRLFATLKYLRIEPGLSREELARITVQVLEANLPLLGPHDDYWVSQRVSRGVRGTGQPLVPTVVVECHPLPLKERARFFRDGLRVVVPSVRRTPPECLSPRAKVHNYLNLIQGDLEVHAQDPEALAVLLDMNGNIAEGRGSNFFIVKDRVLRTPRDPFVLGGISRQTVLELAREEGIEARLEDIAPFDAYTADEVFVTSTSFCICPVATFNGAQVSGPIPGAITGQLQRAYSNLVGMDIVGQYLAHLK